MFYLEDKRNELYQWDINRRLVIEDETINQVHFCNRTDDCSLVVECYQENGTLYANIPNILLQDRWDIKAYLYADGQYTKQCGTLKVMARTKPVDYVYTETEALKWYQLEAEIKADVEANNEAIRAEVKTALAEASNTLKGMVYGAGAVRIDDIAPNANNIEVKASSKNLLDLTPILNTDVSIPSAQLICGADGGITGLGTPEEYLSFPVIVRELEAGFYTLSVTGEFNNICCNLNIIDKNNTLIKAVGVFKSKITNTETLVQTFELQETCRVRAEIKRYSKQEMSGTAYFQLEKGLAATPYTQYNANASATGYKTYYGKNIFKYSYNDWKFIEEKNQYYIDIENLPISSKVIISGKFADGVVKGETEVAGYISVYKSNDDWVHQEKVAVAQGIWVDKKRYTISFDVERGYKYQFRTTKATYDNSIKSNVLGIQIEIGGTATEYEEYKGKVDGVIVVYPTTTIIADTPGTALEATYNRDINKAYEELYNAILSLGGNV